MNDRGAASIYAAAVGLTLTLTGLAVAVRGTQLVAAAQARSAADLGALAGAMRAGAGAATACVWAGEVVSANGGVMRSCTVDGLDVLVTAEVRGRTATARAGPVRGW